MVSKKVPAHVNKNSVILAKENKNIKPLDLEIVINMLENIPFRKCSHISERTCMFEVR